MDNNIKEKYNLWLNDDSISLEDKKILKKY